MKFFLWKFLYLPQFIDSEYNWISWFFINVYMKCPSSCSMALLLLAPINVRASSMVHSKLSDRKKKGWKAFKYSSLCSEALVNTIFLVYIESSNFKSSTIEFSNQIHQSYDFDRHMSSSTKNIKFKFFIMFRVTKLRFECKSWFHGHRINISELTKNLAWQSTWTPWCSLAGSWSLLV